jgi:Ubinuclein conserved middle domain
MLIGCGLTSQEMEGEGGVMGETLTVAVEEAASGTQATKKERDAAPPAQKYRWTDAIKGLVWQLVNLNNELVSMANVIASVSNFIFRP